jgi:two-component system, NarL family, nitrate/nitrite response regulator NarL
MRDGAPRVVVVERQALVAETLARALGGAFDTRAVVASDESSTGSIAKGVLKARPDVALVDNDLGPHVDCATLIGLLAQQGLQVVVLTHGVDDEAGLGECLRRGAVGVLSKTDGLAPVLSALQRALRRQPVMDHEDARHLMAAAQNAKNPRVVGRRRLATLTLREREVLKRLMTGATTAEIARAWCVSEKTVRTQVKSILAKLEVSSQLAATALAHHNGWTPENDERTTARS